MGTCVPSPHFSFTHPISLSFSVVLVLIIPRLTLSETGRISCDRQEQTKFRHLKSAQQHFGSEREDKIPDPNCKATYFHKTSQKRFNDEK